MKIGVNLKIDVTKIDKTRIFEGKNGKYVDMVCFVDTEEQDQFGNHGRIDQSVSKEEKQQGVKGPILGNARVFWKDEQTQQTKQESQDKFEDDSIPF
jgi:hypothetical protein